jgi:hypothetical protein
VILQSSECNNKRDKTESDDVRKKVQEENFNNSVKKYRENWKSHIQLMTEFTGKWWTIDFKEYEIVGNVGKNSKTKVEEMKQALGPNRSRHCTAVTKKQMFSQDSSALKLA